MKSALSSGLAAVLACLLLTASSRADEPRPGSVLVFPTHHADDTRFTLISVTNTSTTTAVRAVHRYVLSGEEALGAFGVQDCKESFQLATLTPADTTTSVTHCRLGNNTHGYLVVIAQSISGGNVSHNYLIGSELVIDTGPGTAGMYQLMPASYAAIADDGMPTEVDFDGRIDFDDLEYEALPDDVMIDVYYGLGKSRLNLLNLSGDSNASVAVQFNIWNDNERALSSQVTFRCWFELSMDDLSNAFTQKFLANNTTNDPREVDLNCDGSDNMESGWAIVRGLSASGPFQSTSNPPLLGALSGGKGVWEGGRLLWGSKNRSNGEF